MNLPPGPKLPALLQTLKIITQPIPFLTDCQRRYGDSFTLRVLGVNSPPVVFLSHPTALQAIFTNQSDHFELGKITHVFRPLVGDQSLIMQDGDRHSHYRQMLMPALHGEQLYSYGQLICEISQNQTWKRGDRISIREPMAEISLDIILRVVFGLQVGTRYHQLKALISPLLSAVTSSLYSLQFFFPPLQQNLGTWSPWGHFLQQQQQIDQLLYAEIAERRLHPRTNQSDVLSLLMSAQDEQGNTFSDQELRDQLLTLLFLGHETTASALAWAFYWLHRYPHTLHTLHQDLATLGEYPNPQTIAQLPYLTAVCKEALRVYPIALISQPRLVKTPLHLQGYDYQPGDILIPCIYTAHQRPQTYPNPQQFHPERFLDRKFTPYEYLPFGGGSRSCIGMALSLYEMKLILATLLSRYQFRLPDLKPIQPQRRGITFVPPSDFQLIVSEVRSRVSPVENMVKNF